MLTGYSDHTLGDVAACASVAMGACVLEKHFTLDRSLPGPDHAFAVEPNELLEMVTRIPIELAKGDGYKVGPRAAEQEMYKKVRRSVHVNTDVKKGDIITNEMLVVKRPGYGVEPYRKAKL